MPSIPCPNLEICPGTDSPLGNFSSEAPDPPSFFRLNFPWVDSNNPVGGNGGGNLPPPSFFAGGCATICESQISQEDANLCAARAAYICAHSGGPNGPTTQFFYSTLQVCNINCPDGSVFAYRVFPGAFVSTSQAQADELAAAYACRLAGASVICMSGLPTSGCLGVAYRGTVSSTARGTPPFTFSLVAGELPPGLTLTQVSPTAAVVTGAPTMPGNYSFTLQLVDARGNFSQHTYTVAVLNLTNSPTLANKDQVYSFAYTAAGGTGPYTYFLAAGSLPLGLTLLSDGSITGAPTTAGTTAFTVAVTDSTGASCTFVSSITVQSVCVADTGPAVPVQWNGAAQPAQVRIVNYQAFADALSACPACVYDVGPPEPPVWDGTLPFQYAPDNFNLRYQPSGSTGPAVAVKLLVGANLSIWVSMELVFISGQWWKLEINCFDILGHFVPNPVWLGHKVTGLTPDSASGTYMIQPGTLSPGPACLHIEVY